MAAQEAFIVQILHLDEWPLVAHLAVVVRGEPLSAAALGGLVCVTAGLLVGLRPPRPVLAGRPA